MLRMSLSSEQKKSFSRQATQKALAPKDEENGEPAQETAEALPQKCGNEISELWEQQASEDLCQESGNEHSDNWTQQSAKRECATEATALETERTLPQRDLDAASSQETAKKRVSRDLAVKAQRALEALLLDEQPEQKGPKQNKESSQRPVVELQQESSNDEPPQDLSTWTEHTQSQLSLAMSLREEVSQILYSPLVEHNQSTFTDASVSTSATQQKLGRSIQNADHVSRVLFDRIEQARHTIQQVSTCMSRLLNSFHEKDLPLKVVDKRLEFRMERPRKEALQDSVQDALDAERSAIIKARKSALKHIQDGQHILQSLEDCKTQLIACVKHKRDVVRLDRACRLFDGFHTEDCVLKQKEKAQRARLKGGEPASPQELMEAASSLEDLSAKFLREAEALVSRSKLTVEQMGFATTKCLSKRTADIAQVKRQLEKEAAESGNAIKRLEQSIETMMSQLRGNSASSPRIHRKLSSLLQDPEQHLDHRTIDYLETLDKQTGGVLERAMIAAGNKQGLVGLQNAERILAPHAEVIALSRSKVAADLAASHEKLVIRRLTLLTGKLESQQESVDNELATVRSAKETVTEALEERLAWAKQRHDQLQVALAQIDEDRDNKAAAWMIDIRCSGISVSNVEANGKDKWKKASGSWQLHAPRPYRAPLNPEALDFLREKVRAASYTGHAGCELDVLFRRFDKRGDGQLDEAEFRMALRRILRVPPSLISDAQISSVVAMLDKDGTGQVGVTELVDFLGVESDVSKRTGKSLHGAMGEHANMVGASGQSASSPRRGNEGKIAPARAYRAPLKKAALAALRIQIKSASYTGAFGRQLDVVFGRFDKDSSGQLEDDEVRQALRRVLRIPPSMLTDAQIIGLCATLDADNSGNVSIQELVNFVGTDNDSSQRTGKAAGVSQQARQLLEEEGLPQVSARRQISLLQAPAMATSEPTEDGQKVELAAAECAEALLPPVTPGRCKTGTVKADPSHVRSDFLSQDPLQSQVLPNLAG